MKENKNIENKKKTKFTKKDKGMMISIASVGALAAFFLVYLVFNSTVETPPAPAPQPTLFDRALALANADIKKNNKEQSTKLISFSFSSETNVLTISSTNGTNFYLNSYTFPEATTAEAAADKVNADVNSVFDYTKEMFTFTLADDQSYLSNNQLSAIASETAYFAIGESEASQKIISGTFLDSSGAYVSFSNLDYNDDPTTTFDFSETKCSSTANANSELYKLCSTIISKK